LKDNIAIEIFEPASMPILIKGVPTGFEVAMGMDLVAELSIASEGHVGVTLTAEAGIVLTLNSAQTFAWNEVSLDGPRFEGNLEVSVGPRLFASIEFLGLIEAALWIQPRVQMNLEVYAAAGRVPTGNYHHDCNGCLEGLMYFLLASGFTVTYNIGNWDGTLVDQRFPDMFRRRLGQFYFSFLNHPNSIHGGNRHSGWGACPNILHSITFEPINAQAQPISSANTVVTRLGTSYPVLANGIGRFDAFLRNGYYTATTTYQGVQFTRSFAIDNMTTGFIGIPAVFVPVAGVYLNKTEMDLRPNGASGILSVAITPLDASNSIIEWSTSNPSVATVNAGIVTAVGHGTAIIIATTHNGLSASTVVTSSIPVNRVSLYRQRFIATGDTELLSPTITPNDATNQSVTWFSDNPVVATVDGSGRVTAHSPGEAIIRTTTVDGGRMATTTIIVTSERLEDFGILPAVTFTPTLILDDIPLPLGYVWLYPETPLNVAASGSQFHARFTYPTGECVVGFFVISVAPTSGVFVPYPNQPINNISFSAGMELRQAVFGAEGYAWVNPSTPITSAGTHQFYATFTCPSGNFTTSPPGNVTVNIARGRGAYVTSLQQHTVTHDSITVFPVTLSPASASTGQVVEYALFIENNPNFYRTWQASTEFTGLTPGVRYVVHARSVGNNNFDPGPSVSQPIQTLVVGDGTATNPFRIRNLEDLEAVGRGIIRNGVAWGLNHHYRMYADIDLPQVSWGVQNWTPIGHFTGNFDGNGHVIRNMSIYMAQTPVADGQGMFRSIGDAGVVRNLGLVNAQMNINGNNIGGIAGINTGIIENSFVTGSTIVGGLTVGGIVGHNNGGITRNTFSIINVESLHGSNRSNVGGVAGANTTGGIVTNGVALGERVVGVNNVRRVVGYNQAIISGLYARRNMSVNGNMNHHNYLNNSVHGWRLDRAYPTGWENLNMWRDEVFRVGLPSESNRAGMSYVDWHFMSQFVSNIISRTLPANASLTEAHDALMPPREDADTTKFPSFTNDNDVINTTPKDEENEYCLSAT